VTAAIPGSSALHDNRAVPAESDGKGPSRHRLGETSRRTLRLAFTLGSLFLAVHLVLPQIGGLTATADALTRGTWWLPLFVLVLEAASFGAYGELELVVLRAVGEDPRRGLVQRSTVVGSSLGKTLPGGTATATAMIVSALRAHGMRGASATAGLAASGAISWAVLGLLLPVGAILAIAGGESGAIALGAAVIAAAIVGLLSVAPAIAVRRPERVGELVTRLAATVARGPFRGWVEPAALGSLAATGLTSVRSVTGNRRALGTAAGWAAANWLLDAAVLGALAATVGDGTPLLAILLAYVIGQLLAAVPITPGGVGIVEPAMTGALLAAGAPAAGATATVLGWRLVSHWLPILVGLGLLPTVVSARPRRSARG
jgi:uncharacterized membrane protein YbhN (UPF0104 family)